MPVVASNILDRQFEAERPNQKWIADFTYIWTAEDWLYVAAVIDLFSRRVVGWSMSTGSVGRGRTADGRLETRQAKATVASLRSGEPVQQRAVPAIDGRQRHCLQREPVGQRVGQCSHGELLLLPEDRAHGTQNLSHQERGQGRCVRLHRALLQRDPTPFEDTSAPLSSSGRWD